MDQEIEQVTALYQTVVSFLVNYSFQIFGAIVIMVIGVLVGRKVGELVRKICRKHELDPTLSNFIAAGVRIAIIAMVAIMALNKVGISVTPLLATVGAISLGAGLAIQGLVSNYGAGLNIIVARRFVVGDTIEVNGAKGLVTSVHLGYTMLKDEDGVEIMVPNRHIVGEVIKNSQKDMLIENKLNVSYGQSPQQAVDIIKSVLNNAEQVNAERTINVGVENFGDSAIELGIRYWVVTEHYFEYRYQVNLAIYEALLNAGITVAVPQRDVHLTDKTVSAD